MNEFSLIWNDAGSGADRDVSIWSPLDIENGFYRLGDTATASHSKPNIPALTVSALSPGALAQPTGYTEIWNDGGSGSDDDVRILRMTNPSGYTCLGYLAVKGYGTVPDLSQYRYVYICTIMHVYTVISMMLLCYMYVNCYLT